MFIIIVYWLGCDRQFGLLFRAPLLLSILTPLFLPSSSVYLISSLLFPCANVWETLVHEFPISYSSTEWEVPFLSQGEIVLALAEALPIKI